jgi:pyruvate-ferredoxin/flavodoxin oxidoreductase
MRYSLLAHSSPEIAAELLEQAQEDVRARWRLYEHWASMPVAPPSPETPHA